MSDIPAQDNLELEVKDFGPIIKAKIDLRPLTVFVGPSDTGKSYLAILIYALHRHFNANKHNSNWQLQQDYRTSQKEKKRNFTPEIKNLLTKFAKRIINTTGKFLIIEDIVISNLVQDVILTKCEDVGSYLNKEICRCFGLDSAQSLIRNNGTKNSNIVFRMPSSTGSASVKHELAIDRKKYRTRSTVTSALQNASFKTNIPVGMLPGTDKDQISGRFGRLDHLAKILMSLDDPKDGEVHEFLDALADCFMPAILGPLHHLAFYLPAGRTGIMQAHNVVVNALIEHAPMAGLRQHTHMPMLTGVLADFLRQLIEFDRPPYRRREPQHDLGYPIEHTILRGSVGIDKSEAIGYPHFTYRPEGWKDSMSLMNASSMVSELAPVVLYLRHKVEPGNVLIVEEPESHLHPAMQVEFTRQLAALVHAGIRVIVTTHSLWVLEELANIVHRSELTADAREKTVNGNFALEPDQVGAWLFQPKSRRRGSIVKEIRLDDSGLFPSGFTDVAVDLHNDWADIASQVGEAE